MKKRPDIDEIRTGQKEARKLVLELCDYIVKLERKLEREKAKVKSHAQTIGAMETSHLMY